MIDLAPAEMIAVERAVLLVGPLLLAALLILVRNPTPREATAAMVAFLWQLPALLLLNLLAQHLGLWRFAGERNLLAGLPIDVWIGWAIWWGPVASLLLRRVAMPWLIAAFVAVNLATMPLLQPLVVLGSAWLAGEVLACLIALVPGLVFARLTAADRRPLFRAAFHCLGWGGYVLLVIPVAVLSYEGRGLDALLELPQSVGGWATVGLAGLLLLVGIAATAEFAIVGAGTPIPLDPPKRVVTTGPYAFLANPMQTISALLMLVIAIHFRSWGLALVSLSFFVFDLVYATWYNRAHIARVMTGEWGDYQTRVGSWRPQWRPYVQGDTQLTISPSGPMRKLWDRMWPRFSGCFATPIDIREHAEDAVPGRLVYERPEAGVRDTGIIAAARLLEHGPIPFAFVGWLIRFPLLGSVLQLASGFAIRVFRL